MVVPDVPLASSDPTWHLPFARHGQTGSGPGNRGVGSKSNGDRSYCTQRMKRSNRGWKNQCAPRLYLCCCNIAVTSAFRDWHFPDAEGSVVKRLALHS